MTATGGATSNLGSVIGGMVPGGQAPGTVVGQETPEWEFPLGQHRVADDVMSNFLRVDAGPTGLNEYLRQNMQTNPAVVSRFRDYVRMGIIRPKNAAAQNIVTGYGGYQAGDMTPLGPMINGMPSGLTESQLNTFSNILQTGTQYNLGLLDQMGYFDGMPTLEREQVMGQLAQGWMDQATQQFLATESQRAAMAQEGLSQQEITNQNIQQMASIFGGQTVTDPATGQSTFQPTEQAREFNTEQSGWLNGDATLTREQQAFNQAKDVANLASNPRNYIEAQMLGNARGGLGGMQPNNQIQQTTFGPPTTTTQMPQFNAPGGQFNQMPGLSTMTGAPGTGAQAGTAMAMPNAQQQAQGPIAPSQFNLANRDVWSQMGNQAGQQWGTAQQGLATMNANQGFQSLRPPGTTYSGPGPGQPPWPGVPSQLGGQAQATVVGGTATPEQQAQRRMMLGGNQQNVAGVANQPVAVSAFTNALMQNRVVPRTGAIQGQGSWQTPGQIQGSFNPNKIRTQDYLKGNTTERAMTNAVGSMAGYSDEDLGDIMKNNLPSFSAPGAGRMI